MGFLPRRATTRDDHRQRVLRALVWAETHLESDLSLGVLARVGHLSPFHFQRVFTTIVGESPDVYVRKLRLRRAAVRLLDGDEQIAAIAWDAAHQNVESFTRAFRAEFREPPGKFRARRRRPPIAIGAPRTIRAWVNAAGRGAQLRFVPIALSERRASSARAFRVEQLTPLRVAYVRRSESSAREADDFTRLAAFAQPQRGPTPSVQDFLFLVLHHDDPRVTPRARQRVDRCVVVGPRRRGTGDLGVRTIGGGDYAVATQSGARAQSPTVVRWLERVSAVERKSPRRHGPWIEVLLDDPRRARRGSRLIDVLVPVQAPVSSNFWYWCRKRAGGA